MPRYVAFLRAINVGGHIVKMDTLKKTFAGLGLKNVDTFIASGNVLFSSPSKDTARLERLIEAQLRKDLGYEVATFVRSTADVIAIAGYQPFQQQDAPAGLYVGFLGGPVTAEARTLLARLATAIDMFHITEREWYWLAQRKQGESNISNAVIERTLKVRSTLRGMNTIVRLAGRLQTQVDSPAPARRRGTASRTKKR